MGIFTVNIASLQLLKLGKESMPKILVQAFIVLN
ncbi:hypothetical protein M2135_001426 [Parabacteroides sp. PF5-9]|nr:hypothetical protein [Parabacteroides sp. PF5-9]